MAPQTSPLDIITKAGRIKWKWRSTPTAFVRRKTARARECDKMPKTGADVLLNHHFFILAHAANETIYNKNWKFASTQKLAFIGDAGGN
jgi:hypothetical protein